ncbi:MAG: substrate-binding domain-containing protein [Planctomycetota bacterium]
MKGAWLFLIGSTALAGGLIWGLAAAARDEPPGAGGNVEPPLTLYCAASARSVIESVLADYQAETGARVRVQYGASQHLLATLQVSGAGDFYLPADAHYLDLAEERSLLRDRRPLAQMRVVVAVRPGNPKRIESFADLLRDDITLVQASPESAAIGHVTRAALTERGDWEPLRNATKAFRTTISEAANDVLAGAADAAIVYDAFLHTVALESIPLPELAEVRSEVAVGTLSSSRNPEAARRLAQFLASPERGLKRLEEHGFDTRPIR